MADQEQKPGRRQATQTTSVQPPSTEESSLRDLWVKKGQEIVNLRDSKQKEHDRAVEERRLAGIYANSVTREFDNSIDMLDDEIDALEGIITPAEAEPPSDRPDLADLSDAQKQYALKLESDGKTWHRETMPDGSKIVMEDVKPEPAPAATTPAPTEPTTAAPAAPAPVEPTTAAPAAPAPLEPKMERIKEPIPHKYRSIVLTNKPIETREENGNTIEVYEVQPGLLVEYEYPKPPSEPVRRVETKKHFAWSIRTWSELTWVVAVVGGLIFMFIGATTTDLVRPEYLYGFWAGLIYVVWTLAVAVVGFFLFGWLFTLIIRPLIYKEEDESKTEVRS